MSARALVVGDAEAFGVAGVILHRLRLDLVLPEEACPLPITRLPLLRDYPFGLLADSNRAAICGP
jgi:hypothetical protein